MTIAEDHFAGPDEVTKEVDVSAFQEKLLDDQRSLVKDAKRALLNAALSLSKAGDAVSGASDQITNVLQLLNKLVL